MAVNLSCSIYVTLTIHAFSSTTNIHLTVINFFIPIFFLLDLRLLLLWLLLVQLLLLLQLLGKTIK